MSYWYNKKRYWHSKRSNKTSIDQDELLGFIKWLYERNTPRSDILAVELLYGSGLRISEATTLTFERVYFDQNTIKVMGKGQKERIVPMTSAAKKLLLEIYNERICTAGTERSTNKPPASLSDTPAVVLPLFRQKDLSTPAPTQLRNSPIRERRAA
jgi:site-specific recombinase XerD